MVWWHALLFLLGSVPVLFYAWLCLHEVSHHLVMKYFDPKVRTSFKLYPHREGDQFYWGRVVFLLSVAPPEEDLAWVWFAPRWANLLAVFLFPLGVLLPPWGALVWFSFWGAGLVDGFVGSLGVSDNSDMAKYALIWNINRWVFRGGGLALVLLSAGLGVGLLFL